MDDICGLFKLAGIPDDVVKKKAFPLSLEGDALTWYRLCDDTRSWNYKRVKLEFHQKYYPMHLVHCDRKYINNFWPREGDSIAQSWGRLKSMLYSLLESGSLPSAMADGKGMVGGWQRLCHQPADGKPVV